MLVVREYMISATNFKRLTQNQKLREINDGFIYTLRRQICLDQLLNKPREYHMLVNLYIKMVAFNTKLRVYCQHLICKNCPSTYQPPPRCFTPAHFQDYCADTLSIIEQLKKCPRSNSVLPIMRTALNDIMTAQQEIIDILKTGKHWNDLFTTVRMAYNFKKE